MRTTHSTGAPPLAEPALGIWFDGRAYHYQQYRYEHLRDALAYATVDARRPDYRPPAPPQAWTQWHGPDAAETELMAIFGIRYEQGMYRYQEYRYDDLEPALAYARLVTQAAAPPAAPRGARQP